MRPVDKGAAPAVYANYRDAAPDLQARIGEYCSYCERRIETHLAIEHIQPKSLRGSLRNDWSNFLLSCVNCNSCKGHKRVRLGNYFWPDSENTLRALEYVVGGIVRASGTLPVALAAKANATIRLTGLDRVPGHPSPKRRPSKSDKRWLKRTEVWQLAEKCRQRLTLNDCEEVRALIVEVALGRGMFSIWWTLFAGEVDVRRRLRLAFLGTDHGSFDVNEDLRTRLGGQL